MGRWWCSFSLLAWGRLWLADRRVQALTGFLQVELGLQGQVVDLTDGGIYLPPSSQLSLGPAAGVAGGAEYLLTPHLGLCITLGVRGVYLLGGPGQLGASLLGGLGLMLHQ